MSRKQSQKDNVLKHLKQHGMITPLDALKLYGAFRLGAIIHTLRHEDGYNIKTDLAKGDAKYAIYSLLPSDEEMVERANVDYEMKEVRTSMQKAADAEDPKYHVQHQYLENPCETDRKDKEEARRHLANEYNLIEETKRALGFGDDDE